jgi:hypothetical protein
MAYFETKLRRIGRENIVKTITPKEKFLVLVVSWLIPGYGFFHNGMRKHALAFFIILQFTFLVGCALQGSVLMPDFNYRSEGFNLVIILTFVTQMFNGLLGIISLLPDIGGPAILPYNETYHWADLGSLFLLVSGGMNYFVIVSTYDHFYGHKRLSPDTPHQPAQEPPSQ